jgi:hypothetical protein
VCTDTGAGMNVSSVSNGDYIKVKDVDFQGGVTSFEARVSSSAGNTKIELRLESQTGTLLGTCDVSGASSWTTKTCQIGGGSGKHDLFMKFVGGSGDLFKFNWWRFAPLGTGISNVNNIESGNRVEMAFIGGSAPSLQLVFSLPGPRMDLQVGVFDLTGRLVKTLFSGPTAVLQHSFRLNDAAMHSGIYLVRASLDGKTVLSESIMLW